MTSAYDVDTNELIIKLAESLKKEGITPPEWSKFVKTGMGRQRPPVQADWWYTRCAGVLRSVYVKGPIGVQKLRTKYGNRKQRGSRVEHFYRSGGSILRECLQQLENLGYVKKSTGKEKGREITAKGKSLLDKTASVIKGGANVKK